MHVTSDVRSPAELQANPLMLMHVVKFSGSFIKNITASDQMHLNFSSIKFLPLSVPIIGDAGSLSLYNIKIIICLYCISIFIIFYDAYREISS